MAHCEVNSLPEGQHCREDIVGFPALAIEVSDHFVLQKRGPFQHEMNRDLQTGMHISNMLLPLGKPCLIKVRRAYIDKPVLETE